MFLLTINVLFKYTVKGETGCSDLLGGTGGISAQTDTNLLKLLHCYILKFNEA